MDKKSTEGVGIFAQHYPRVAAIITSQAEGKINAMTAAWHMPVSYNPPLYSVAIAPKRFSHRLISASKEFAVNFMPGQLAETVVATGGSEGASVDKFRAFHINQDKPIRTLVPILRSAYAAYECKLIEDKLYGDHRLLIGEIVAVHWLKEAFMEDGSLDLAKVSPLMYLGNEHYVSASDCSVRTIEREFCIDCFKAKS
jgi:flavin reductase (DIM6/NTAB) family NADH-FMN oxidoreductase RutF